ncbi:MAG: dicarboxylate/amino acid:cation symporter [Pelagibacteraceae bacterium TMED237]|nr:dicarboxylate/amino acid:cation symporter [Candidatus Neomarinimicrobiota bacterium]OUW96656.1 MAG: dicarboxylate/amino acid:cation symporter [Pelagibacteraceae bacterium TMED237]|tara:strand:+ start:1264 stop:2499 length:1236 start_codon:yes stop_codon:yes gene_type:complete
MKLHWKILMAMGLGILVGLLYNNSLSMDNTFYDLIVLLGDIFIRLLKMVIVPLVLTSIIIGISSINDRSKIGRMGIKTIIYYISTSLIAILIGLSLVNTIKPGEGANPISGIETYDASQLQSNSIIDIFKRMVPENPIDALASGDMLSIIFFAIFFGLMLNFVDTKHSKPVLGILNSIYQIILKMTQIILKTAPIGVFGLIVKAVSTSGLSIFKELSLYAITLISGLSIHLFIVIPLILILIVKVNPIKHFKAISSAMVTAFSTSSSSATLPVTIKCVKDNIKVSNETSSFVLPMGATINMDGTALYECVGVLFIAQAIGIPLDASQQFVVVITALLASIGAAGIPSAGTVMLFIVTEAVGLQSDVVAVWVGSMLAIDRPLDMFRTMVNVSSDSVGAAVIAKSEGEKLYSN